MILSFAITTLALVAAYAVFFIAHRLWPYLRELSLFLMFITFGLTMWVTVRFLIRLMPIVHRRIQRFIALQLIALDSLAESWGHKSLPQLSLPHDSILLPVLLILVAVSLTYVLYKALSKHRTTPVWPEGTRRYGLVHVSL